MGQKQTSDNANYTSDEDIDAVLVGRDDVSDYNPEQILPESPDVIEKLRDWLQPTAYDIAGGEYRKHISSHVAGTGAWLTASDAYQKWLHNDEHGLLWIKGIPGSGKSVMAAKLIHDLAQSNPTSPVLFFFFRQIIDANHEPRALLRDWLDQILRYSPPLQKQLKVYIEAGRSLESISMEDLWKHLRLAFVSLPDKVFCVADALDEIDRGHEEFIQTLGKLGHWRPKTVKVLITSRPVPSVEVPLRTVHGLHLRLQETLVDMDISTYVHFMLSKSDIPKTDWDTIANAVPGRANGLFLYAKLAMDAFLEPGANVTTVLSKLPLDLNSLYTDLLNEHATRSGVPENIQRLILQAVTHASRPLRLLELAEMIRVSRPDGVVRDIRATKDLIRTACGPLLEILPDETISVIHHSFTEYLKGMTQSNESHPTGYPELEMGPTHAQLALQCLLYLQSGCLNPVIIDTRDDISRLYWRDWGLVSDSRSATETGKLSDEEVQLRLKYPLFQYAVSNWHRHIVKSEAAGQDQTEINATLRQLFEEGNNLAAWLQIMWPGRGVGAKKVTQLHVAAKTGLISYTKELLANYDVNLRDHYDRTPVWWAAVEGHAKVISVLVDAGADPDVPDNITGIKPLHRAAHSNHSAAVTALLKAGVDPLTPKTLDAKWLVISKDPEFGQTPLLFACGGHVEAVEAFLPFIGDNIDLVHRTLIWAAKAGSAAVVARLLQHPGIDVNTIVEGETALYRACNEVQPDMVAMLLQAGAFHSIDCAVGSDRALDWTYDESNPVKLNCFFALCAHNMFYGIKDLEEKIQAVFELLREAGADINFRTSTGETALHIAVGSPILVRLLLEAGADGNATNRFGTTPLHHMFTTKSWSVQSMVLLIEEGHANINAVRENGMTPLHCLMSSYNKDAAKKFLEYEPNCNVIDNEGDNPLHIFIRGYTMDRDFLKILLEKGADPNAKNHEGLTPLLCLHSGADWEFTKTVQLLQDAGANINEVDRDGNNLLFLLLAHNPKLFGKDSHKEFTFLIDRGLSLSQRNFHGQTMLHKAVKEYGSGESYRGSRLLNISRLDFLINLNLDVKAVDYSGNSLLHTLAMRWDSHNSYQGGAKLVVLWRRLVDLGLDIQQKNHAGRTPLHILCTSTYSVPLTADQGEFTPIDFVISQVKSLDVPDNDGVTPLHIAVTRSEILSKKLIDAGANPLVYTHEGLTPLHFAARCRESNIVGLLLSAMQKRQGKASASILLEEFKSTNLDKKATKSEATIGINAKMHNERSTITPLFYAIMSGRPESVALLLSAGANVKMGNIFEACLEFEDEIHLQSQSKPPQSLRNMDIVHNRKFSETYLAARSSAFQREGSPSLALDDTARLEEIMDMLVDSGADISLIERSTGEYDYSIMKKAITKNKDYTAACLARVLGKESLDSETNRSEDELTRVSGTMHQFRKQASIEALRSIKSHIAKNHDQYQTVSSKVLTWCLALREYHLVEELSQLGISFLPRSKEIDRCNLYHLIRLGLASLFESIASREAELTLSKGDWHAFGDITRPGLWHANKDDPTSQLTPFIIVTVKRELPNMEILKLLVEKFAVDINETDASDESALFHLVRGNHWWHVHQALPYLLDAGASINMRNAKGQTLLHTALKADYQTFGPYNWDAAKLLIERGADVNAVDSSEQSCLACAQYNADTVKFLIKHGAVVALDSIFAAIDSKKAEVLRALLSGGMDPNTRRDQPLLDLDEESQNIEPHEIFPLYYAASKVYVLSQPFDNNYEDASKSMEVVQVLLDHGADPFAKFLRPVSQFEKEQDCPVVTNPSIPVPKGYAECTLLHEVLLSGYLGDTFLQIPNLDVHHRDAKGRTLLHMVCESKSGPDHIIGSYIQDSDRVLKERVHTFQRLLSLGSNLTAQDNYGRNVLHYMLVGENIIESTAFPNFLAYTLQNAPELLNQGDNNGETPLHHAMIRALDRKHTSEAEMLLEAGADPMIISKRGDTMLHILGEGIAITAIRTFFQALIDRGIDINARNARGETALFSFYSGPKTERNSWLLQEADTPHGEHVKPMLEKLGGDFFVIDNEGRGLLHAAARGDVERFQELMDLGLDPMIEDNAQQTAIDAAAACGNRDVLELFEKK
ncbi:putative ankyrin repeat protein [Trichoderma evansii]